MKKLYLLGVVAFVTLVHYIGFSSVSIFAQTLTDEIKIEVLRLCQGVGNPNTTCTRKGEPVEDPITNGRFRCLSSDTSYGCGSSGYPFGNENPVTLTMKEYVRNVVPNEAGSVNDPFEFKAQAIVSRMYGHFQYTAATNNPPPDYINNSIEKQVYIPNSAHPNTDNAVNQTEGMLLIYNSSIINALFSANHGVNSPNPDMTREGNTDYLRSVYDPVIGGTDIAHGWGMAQRGAINWATGLQDGNNYHPIWDFRRILAYYYTAIDFQNVPNIRNDYRANVIQISNFPDNYTFTPSSPIKNDITLIVQNSGSLPWYPGQGGTSTCSAGSYNMSISYHLYDENNNQIACGNPGVPGSNPCFEGTRTRMCVLFPNAETPPGGSFIIDGVTVNIPSQLPRNRCYNLRWDVELYNNHPVRTWVSRLQQTPWQAQWPTQDTRICYFDSVAGNPDPPSNAHATSGHTANTWSKEPDITVAWDAPSTPVSGYQSSG